MRSVFIGILMLSIVLPTSFALQCDQPKFERYKQSIIHRAERKGIQPSVIQETLLQSQCNPSIVEKAQNQAEFTLTFTRYLHIFITPERVQMAAKLYQKHKTTFDKAYKTYGISPTILLALWNMESKFGQRTGNYHAINALITMAYYADKGKRRSFFENELFSLLTSIEKHYITPNQLNSSWAGAMGLFQFMPITYLHYSVDANGDGKKDIWHTEEDAILSAANYLYRMGWHKNQTVIIAVTVQNPVNVKRPYTVATLVNKQIIENIGVLHPFLKYKTKIIQPFEDKSKGYIVLHNYFVLKLWNRATFFDLAVPIVAKAFEPVLTPISIHDQ